EEWQNLHRLESSSKELQNSMSVEKPYYSLGKPSSLSNTMPSRRKTLMFASAFFTSLCSFAIVCVVLATKNWVSSDLTNQEKSRMRLIITYGLFQGTCSDVSPGINSANINFQVLDLPVIMPSATHTKHFWGLLEFIPGILCLVSICCLLNLILFAVNVEVNKLSTELAITHCAVYTGFEQSNSYGYSYWIMLLIIALNATTVIIIVFYQRAKYSKKKERERPLDSAPKDGILF
ncbi:hypothetical protein E2320_008522, partial [Naja naja]